MSEDAVNNPKHYNSHPSGVECITITEHMTFNVGNAVKYLWRAGLKDSLRPTPSSKDNRHLEDLRKAAWYIQREIEKLGGKAMPLVTVTFDPSIPRHKPPEPPHMEYK